MLSSREASAMRRIQPRSAPAEKDFPVEASTRALTCGLSLACAIRLIRCAISRSSKALWTSGRFRVMVATPRASMTRSAAWLMVCSLGVGYSVRLGRLVLVLLSIDSKRKMGLVEFEDGD